LLITNDPNLPKTVIHVEQEKVKGEWVTGITLMVKTNCRLN
jgi:hypothetical protein